jgi:hypothetical protein
LPLCRPAAPKHAGKQVKRGMPKIPLYYQDGEFFEEFGTSCYINHEKWWMYSRCTAMILLR